MTAAGLLAACKKEEPPPAYQAIPVERRDIVVSAQASGTVQPDTVVEVKSKASGEILDLRVETGQAVKRGDLMVRVDPRTPQNVAGPGQGRSRRGARRGSPTPTSQKRRSDELFKSQSITEQEHENALLDYANAKAEVVRAQVAVENAQNQMDDTNVRAPISGTIIEKTVERGQVISSPTSDVGGGTVLLKMADLDLVQVRTLVDETDIGKIKAGPARDGDGGRLSQPAVPGRRCSRSSPRPIPSRTSPCSRCWSGSTTGTGLLTPGMNAEVEIHVGERDGRARRAQRGAPHPAGRGLGGAGAGALTRRRCSRSSRPRRRLATRAGRRPAPAGRRRWAGPRRADPPADTGRADRTRRAGAPGGGRGRSADPSFGGRYIVFVKRPDGPKPVWIRTGLTDLDYSEVVDGLEASRFGAHPAEREPGAVAAGVAGADEPHHRRRRAARHAAAADRAGRRGRARRGRAEPCCSARSSPSPSSPSAPTSCARCSPCSASSSAWAPSSRWWRSGSGAQKAVEERIARARRQRAHRLRRAGVASAGIRITDRTILSTDDYDALAPRRDRCSKAVVPEMQQSLQVKYGNQNSNVNVVGTTPELHRGAQLHACRTAGCSPPATMRPGSATRCSARRCPGCSAPTPPAMIGQTIQIRGIPFEIIGVLSEKGAAGGWGNPDEQILIPLQTARYRVFGTDRLRSISVQVADGVPIEQGMVDIERVLRREHKIRPGRRERLHHPQPAGPPRHPAADHPGVHHAAREHRGGEPPGGRHRDHEHHAGLGDRADPRDRRAQGARRHPAQHHAPVPGRGAGALPRGRRARRARSASAPRSRSPGSCSGTR